MPNFFAAPKTELKQRSVTSAGQSGLLNQLTSLLGPLLGQPDQFQFQGDRVAGLGGLSQDALSFLGQLPNQLGGAATQGFDTIGNLLNPQQNLDPIFSRGQELFNRNSEQIANKFGGLNATSSSASRDAQNRALEQFALASQAQAIPAFLQSQQAGIGGIGQLLGGLGQGVNQLFQGGGLQQGQQQALIDEQIAAVRRQDPLSSPAFAQASQLAVQPTQENIAIGQGAGLGRQLASSFVGGIGGGLGGGFGGGFGGGLSAMGLGVAGRARR